MGTVIHHSIIATCYDEKKISIVREKCIHSMIENTYSWNRCDKLISPLLPSAVNGYYSFCIVPDGSKEGWSDSYQCDKARQEIINILLSEPSIEFVCVEFGRDYENDAKILYQQDYSER